MPVISSTLGILWALLPAGCEGEEAPRPRGSTKPFANPDAGPPPEDKNSCTNYECRADMTCAHQFCRTAEGASEKMCKTINFWEVEENAYIGVPSRICDGPCPEESNPNLATCVLSDTVDFANLEGRSAETAPGAELHRDGVCGGGGAEASTGIFFNAAGVSEGERPWVRFLVSIDTTVENREATFFLLEGKFFPTAEGENPAAVQQKILGMKIDDNQGGPVKIGDWLGDPRAFVPKADIPTPLTADCTFQEIGSYHALLSNQPLRELRVYIQPRETLGLGGLRVWSCTCDTFFGGAIFVLKQP